MEAYAQWKGWEESGFGRFSECEARYYRWHVNRAIAGGAPRRVLEIGFGNGSFLGYGRTRGWEMTGIEISPELRARAERAGFSVAADIDSLAGQAPFDLLVLFDVLEHVEADQLIAFMHKLRALITTDGVILLRVPNGDSPFGGRHQHGDLTHRVMIGEIMLQQVAAACDLRVTSTGESNWRAQQHEPPSLRAWWRYRLRKFFNRALGFAYYGGTVDLSSNLVAVLRPLRAPG
ncbi:MAG TPA: class I SAM-dependent methyltransferase [Burkholderiaceae bacterium]|nr:class I SAM-dependent methyltransferase [Burkholderiaceae bacterium]